MVGQTMQVANTLAAAQVAAAAEEAMVGLAVGCHKNQADPKLVAGVLAVVMEAADLAAADYYLAAYYLLYSTRCLCFCQLSCDGSFTPRSSMARSIICRSPSLISSDSRAFTLALSHFS